MPTQLSQIPSTAPKPLFDTQLSSGGSAPAVSLVSLPPPPPQQGDMSLPVNWKSAQDLAGIFQFGSTDYVIHICLTKIIYYQKHFCQ